MKPVQTREGRSARFVRITLAVACCVSAAFLAGFISRHFWILDLLVHFRVQYAAVLTSCGIALLILRRPIAAVATLAGAVIVIATIVSYTGWPSQSAQAAATGRGTGFHAGFRLVTFNRYFGNEKFSVMGEWLEQAAGDVVAVQEVDSMQTVQKLAARLPSYPHVYAQPQPESDVALFSRWPIRHPQTVELSERGSHVVLAVIDWDGTPITLIGVHLHWPLGAENLRMRNAELRRLAALARTIHGPLLIGGDFNATAWAPAFRDAVDESGLTDCAQGRGLATTWPSWFPPAAIRIDHCLASNHWRVVDLIAGPSLGSDHRAMINDLELKQ